jgi:Rhodopirellula transposase DDE domain
LVNTNAYDDPTVLRLSLDAKATIKTGPFSRGGKNRVETEACDHDFSNTARVTPYGILLPELEQLYIYCTTSKVTSDFIADILESWWKDNCEHFAHIKTLLLNQDNGPENHSRRTQFMKRMVEFANRYKLNLKLAYYPPYHSKYNPIERTWGVLENHWNGSLLDQVSTVIKFAQTMKWKGSSPKVELVTKTYQTGIKLTKTEMDEIENQIQRLPELGKWFVDIYHDWF